MAVFYQCSAWGHCPCGMWDGEPLSQQANPVLGVSEYRSSLEINSHTVLYRCGHSLVPGLFERVELLFLAAQLRRLGKDSASYKRPSLMYLP